MDSELRVNQNKSVSRSMVRQIVRGTTSYFIASATNSVGMFLVSIAISQSLGREGLGIYSMFLVGAMVLLLTGDLGIDSLITRTFSTNQQRMRVPLRAIIGVKACGTLAVVLIALLAMSLTGELTNHAYLAALMFVIPRSISSSLESYLKAKIQRTALVRVSFAITLATLACAVLALRTGIAINALLYLFAGTEVVRLMLLVSSSRNRFPEWSISSAEPFSASAASTVRNALPFAVIGILSFFVARSDVFFLGLLRGAHEAGSYSAAERFLLMGNVFTFALYGSALPIFTSISDMSHHVKTLMRSVSYAAAGALAVTTVLVVFAPFLVSATFQFSESILLLRVLAISFPFLLINTIIGTALFSLHQEKPIAVITAVVCCASVALNLMLIPTYGAIASAVLSVAAETGMTIAFAHLYFTKIKASNLSTAISLEH